MNKSEWAKLIIIIIIIIAGPLAIPTFVLASVFSLLAF